MSDLARDKVIEILIEKYISINGDNEDIFKKDRPAYLIKVASEFMPYSDEYENNTI